MLNVQMARRKKDPLSQLVVIRTQPEMIILRLFLLKRRIFREEFASSQAECPLLISLCVL